jgi:predicted DNA repair protein MutK
MANLYKSAVFTLLVFGSISSIVSLDDDGIYHIGTGIADITGPAAGVVLVRSSPHFLLSSLYILYY